MIAHITKGTSPGGIVRYAMREGRAERHVDPRIIGGSIAFRGDDEELAVGMLTQAAELRPDVRRPGWHVSLRAAPEDPHLDDAQWAEVAATWLRHVGLIDWPHVVMRHGDDHVHVAVSRVRWDGEVWNDGHDFARASLASRKVERAYGLADATDERRRVDDLARVTRTEREQATRTGRVPERQRLAAAVREATELARTDQDLIARLARVGVDAHPRRGVAGDIDGWRFRFVDPTERDRHVAGAGWWSGRSLHRDAEGRRLTARLDATRRALRRARGRDRDLDRAWVREVDRTASRTPDGVRGTGAPRAPWEGRR